MGCLGCPWLDTPWVLIFQEQVTQTTKSGDTPLHFTCKIVTIIQCADWKKDCKYSGHPLDLKQMLPLNQVAHQTNPHNLRTKVWNHYWAVSTTRSCLLAPSPTIVFAEIALTPLLPSLTTPSPSHLSHTKQCANKTCLTLSFHSSVNCRIFNSKSNSYHTKLHSQVENMNTHNHTYSRYIYRL